MERLFEMLLRLAFYALLFGVPAAGLVQRVVVCIERDLTSLLIAGLIVFPVGIVHGWGALLGLW